MFDLPIDGKKIEHNYQEAFERKFYMTVLLCSKSVKFSNERNFLKIINLYVLVHSKTFYFLVI